MSRHPQYSNCSDKNFQDLCKLLFDMERFCIIHPDLYQTINSLMASLYESHKVNLDNDEDEFLDDWASVPDINDLWQALDESDKEQFIQDFGNVIYGSMAGNIETAEDVIGLRNIDEYRENIKIDTDIATNKKYANIKRTPWFSQDDKPVKVGVYEVSANGYENPILCGYASWSGSDWSDSYPLLIDAMAITKIKKEHESYNSHCWRGFSEEV